MRASLLLLAGAALAGCMVSPDGLGVTAGGGDDATAGQIAPGPAGFEGLPRDAGATPPAMGPVSPPPMGPPASPPATVPPAPATPPPGQPQVLRIHDLKVGRLTARIVHAHQLEAMDGSAGHVLPPDPDPLLKVELGGQDLDVAELTVDVLFAHDIKAGWVHIEETHAKVKMGGKGEN